MQAAEEQQVLQNEAQQDLYDVIVIGGGPAGATAALYTARARLRTLVLDKGVRTGALGLAGKIANYPGLAPEISGAELLGRIRDQAASFGAQFAQDKVIGSELDGEVKLIWSAGSSYRSKTVVIASGSLGRSQVAPGEERLIGAGVSYCAICDGAFFQDQEVAVVGNHEEAVEEALLLTRFARVVHLLAPTPELRVPADQAEEIAHHPQVVLHPGARLLEILGEKEVTGVRIAERGGEPRDAAQPRVLPVQGVFVYLQGSRPITDFLLGQLPTSDTGCLETNETMQTSIAGVFAVGDVLCNHTKQAVISAAEGAIAALAIQRYLSGRAKLRPDWS